MRIATALCPSAFSCEKFPSLPWVAKGSNSAWCENSFGSEPHYPYIFQPTISTLGSKTQKLSAQKSITCLGNCSAVLTCKLNMHPLSIWLRFWQSCATSSSDIKRNKSLALVDVEGIAIRFILLAGIPLKKITLGLLSSINLLRPMGRLRNVLLSLLPLPLYVLYIVLMVLKRKELINVT